ncbi:MAG: hypothetical protein V2I51_01995 [Anderseniella sp.]|jgi:hypothetical protein|nr:hypothetical protein [Anderseniella sp.]
MLSFAEFVHGKPLLFQVRTLTELKAVADQLFGCRAVAQPSHISNT